MVVHWLTVEIESEIPDAVCWICLQGDSRVRGESLDQRASQTLRRENGVDVAGAEGLHRVAFTSKNVILDDVGKGPGGIPGIGNRSDDVIAHLFEHERASTNIPITGHRQETLAVGALNMPCPNVLWHQWRKTGPIGPQSEVGSLGELDAERILGVGVYRLDRGREGVCPTASEFQGSDGFECESEVLSRDRLAVAPGERVVESYPGTPPIGIKGGRYLTDSQFRCEVASLIEGVEGRLGRAENVGIPD